MTSISRVACAAAFATLLAIPASGIAAEATIRIEGTTATVLPETAYVLPAQGLNLTIRDTADSDEMSVGGRTAAAQLGNASRLYGIGFGFTDWGQYGFALDSIGGDPSDWNNGPAWFVKHNHVQAAVGAGSLALADGDEVLWALSPLDSNYDMAFGELALTTPTAPLPTGSTFEVRVASYDKNGVRTVGAGATISYRGATVITAADGTATLTASGSGPSLLEVSKAGAIRDTARICAHPADDPTVCNLPPLPRASMPAPGTAGGDVTVRIPVTIRVGRTDVTLNADVPLPEQGGRPVTIRRQMISGADLTPAELRRAMGAVASALAADLNRRAADGQADLVLPRGASWQASWLSGTPYVVPLRRDEAMLGARSGGPRNTTAIRDRAGDLQRHMERCGLGGVVKLVRRHGYALATVSPASVRDDLVRCVEG